MLTRAVLTLIGALLLMAPAPLAFAERPQMPELSLPNKVQGEEAIRSLGDKLSAVAAHYGMTEQRLKEILRNDSTAWIDQRGYLFYVDSAPRPVNKPALP